MIQFYASTKGLCAPGPEAWEIKGRAGEWLALSSPIVEPGLVLDMVFGIKPSPVEARVLLHGTDISALAPDVRARLGVRLGSTLYSAWPRLSVSEHFALAKELCKNPVIFKEQVDGVLRLFPELKNHWRSAAHILSGGQRRILGVATAVVSEPSLVMLQEPFAGLSADASERLQSLIMSRFFADKYCVITSHANSRSIGSWATRVYAIE